MPSLHFATSVTAAHVLGRHGARRRALGWTLRRNARARARVPRRALRRRPRRRADLAEGIRPRHAGGLVRLAARYRAARAGTRGPGAGMNARRNRPPTPRRPARIRTTTTIAVSIERPRGPDPVRLPGGDDRRRSTSCCRSSPGSTTPGNGSSRLADSGWRSPSCSPWGCSAAMWRCSAVSSADGDRIGLGESYEITMAGAGGVADLRRGRCWWSRPAGLGAPAGRAWPGARWPTRTISFLVLTYSPYAAGRGRLRRRSAAGVSAGQAPLRDDRDPAIIGADP